MAQRFPDMTHAEWCRMANVTTNKQADALQRQIITIERELAKQQAIARALDEIDDMKKAIEDRILSSKFETVRSLLPLFQATEWDSPAFDNSRMIEMLEYVLFDDEHPFRSASSRIHIEWAKQSGIDRLG